MAIEDGLLSPIQIPPAYAAVVERLRRMVALGQVLPGERLPSERMLAETFGVSRVTVREALRVLQGEGLIVTKRGGAGGAVIASREVSVEQIRQELRRARPQIDQLFEFRTAVESVAAKLAAERHDRQHMRRLADSQRTLLDSKDVGEFRRADSSFHLTVAGASHNLMLYRAIEDARASMFNSFDALPFKVLRESTASGHAAVIRACEVRDGDAASTAMAEHLKQAHDEVISAVRVVSASRERRSH
jgi:DNA-binding FadR family transcriptional regulator